MNEFRLRATGQVITEQEFRASKKAVFPAVIDATTATAYGLDPVLAAPMPTPDAGTIVVRNGVLQDALGNWVQAWKLEARPAATVAAELTQAKDAAIAVTYTDVDDIYDLAIGRRVTEYTRAEAAARAFMANQAAPVAGYVVSGYVAGFAVDNPTGQVQTNLWSAQQIIGRADAFEVAQLQLRTVRFTAQKTMRAAVNLEQLAAAKHDWTGFILKVRQQLGL